MPGLFVTQLLTVLGLQATLAVGDPQEEHAPPPYNVLFIMTDQHSARALGCYGNSRIRTPNLDRLAEEGVRFSNAFAPSGQCSPSRYSLWTGRYPRSHGLTVNEFPESLAEITIAEVLDEQGYVTGTIGKHHMVHSPKEHGFDVVVGFDQYRAFLFFEGKPHWMSRRSVLFKTPTLVATSKAKNKHHPSGYWASTAIQFIRGAKSRPFCLWLSFWGPHPPIIPSESWASQYSPDEVELPENFADPLPEALESSFLAARATGDLTEDDHRRITAHYYALTSQIDHNVGRVLEELDELGLADRTIVVFTSDHGELMGERGSWGKYVLNYDATTRVPLIVRAPGLPAGAVIDDVVSTVDLMPTLLDLAGAPRPAGVQGTSLVPVILGKEPPGRDFVVSEVGYRGFLPNLYSVMVRTKRHKYVYHSNAFRPYEELFDLELDPWETRNVFGDPDYAVVLDELERRLARWEDETPAALVVGGEAETPSPLGAIEEPVAGGLARVEEAEASGNLEQARAMLASALRDARELDSVSRPALRALGRASARLDLLDGARWAFERFVESGERDLPPRDLNLLDVRRRLALLLTQQGETEAASHQAEAILGILLDWLPDDHPEISTGEQALSALYSMSGDKESFIRLQHQIVARLQARLSNLAPRNPFSEEAHVVTVARRSLVSACLRLVRALDEGHPELERIRAILAEHED